MIGRQIGTYRIVEKLGEGGMGVVYKAVDESLDRAVAVKALSAELSHDPQLVERFRTEAKAQAHLNHTNIATLYSFLLEQGDCFMVMEFVEGESVDSMIRRRGPIPYQEAIPLFRQALLGLGFAHRMGIIHRDIKPSNVMVNRNGIVKVMDFGIAKVMGGRRLTRTGTQMGTVYYMSPEQIRGATLDVRSDIYALGVTLYEMLTAHLPFEGENDFQIMSDHVNTPPPPPSRFYPYLPKGVENAVLKALAKDPNQRFQSVEEFGAALERPDSFGMEAGVTPAAGLRPTVIEAGGPPPTAYGPGAAPPPPPPTTPGYGAPTPPYPPVTPPQPTVGPGAGFFTRGKLIAVGGGALALLAVVIVAMFVLKQPRPTSTPSASAGGGSPVGGQTSGPPPPMGELQQGTALSKPNVTTNENERGGEVPLPSPEKVLGGAESGGPGVGTSPGPAREHMNARENPRLPPAAKTHPLSVPSAPPAPPSAPAAWQQAHNSAQEALDKGHYAEAAGFAQQAEKLGDPTASSMKAQAFQPMFDEVKAAHQRNDYDTALIQLNTLMGLFPERTDLLQMKQSIQQDQQRYAKQQEEQRKSAEQEQQRREREANIKRFNLAHRHVNVNLFTPNTPAVQNSYCAGVLTVNGNDGTITFSTTYTSDGRRDDFTASKSQIRQARMKSGLLHLEIAGRGNFDFYGPATGPALDAIETLMQQK